MAKGVIRGTVWGLVVGGAGAISASLIAEQPAGNTPPVTPQLDVAEAAEVATPDPSTPQTNVSTDSTDVAAAPRVEAPQQEVTAPITDTAPLALPETPGIDLALDAPEPPQVPQLALAGEEPVLPNPQSLAPQVPANEGDLIIETTPAVPVVVEDAAADVVAEDTQEVLVVETPQAVATADVANPAPTAEAAETPAVVETAETSTPVTAGAEDATEVAAEPAGDVAPEPVEGVTAEPVPDVTPSTSEVITPAEEDLTPQATNPALVVAPVEDAQTDVAVTEPPAAPASPAPEVLPGTEQTVPDETPQDPATDGPVVVSILDAPRPALPQGSGGVKVNRVFGSQSAPQPTEAPTPEVAPTDGTPLERYAAAFENPEGKPLMSLILLDDAAFAEAPRALAEVPFGVTVLIDPSTEGAADRMAAFRAQGIEVGVALTLPAGAQPSDVEVTLEASFATLPEAVLLADLTGVDRTTKAQILSALATSGRGFVGMPRGLNAGLGGTSDVPSVDVFRDLDAEGQDARVIRRFLDQAAFRARQNSGVVVLGRMRADTLSALILWGTANRAGQVAVAPVSALLKTE